MDGLYKKPEILLIFAVLLGLVAGLIYLYVRTSNVRELAQQTHNMTVSYVKENEANKQIMISTIEKKIKKMSLVFDELGNKIDTMTEKLEESGIDLKPPPPKKKVPVRRVSFPKDEDEDDEDDSLAKQIAKARAGKRA